MLSNLQNSLQTPSQSTQNAPKCSQDLSKMLPRASQDDQRAPKTAPRDPKSPPGEPKRLPGGLLELPRRAQQAPRGSQAALLFACCTAWSPFWLPWRLLGRCSILVPLSASSSVNLPLLAPTCALTSQLNAKIGLNLPSELIFH